MQNRYNIFQKKFYSNIKNQKSWKQIKRYINAHIILTITKI